MVVQNGASEAVEDSEDVGRGTGVMTDLVDTGRDVKIRTVTEVKP